MRKRRTDLRLWIPISVSFYLKRSPSAHQRIGAVCERDTGSYMRKGDENGRLQAAAAAALCQPDGESWSSSSAARSYWLSCSLEEEAASGGGRFPIGERASERCDIGKCHKCMFWLFVRRACALVFAWSVFCWPASANRQIIGLKLAHKLLVGTKGSSWAKK